MAVKEIMHHFLQEKKILTLATHDGMTPRVSHMYFVADESYNLHFISSQTATHSQHLLTHCSVAFGMAANNMLDLKERIGIQGVGVCRPVTDPEQIRKLLETYTAKFPDLSKQINFEYIVDKDIDSFFWVIKPTYIKFWNDTLLGDKKVVEFHFPENENNECLYPAI